MENIIEWIRLSLSLGGTNAAGELIRKYGTAEKIFSEDPEMLLKAGAVSADTAKKLALSNRAKALAVASTCRNFGWSVITPESEFYPDELKKISDLPVVLYVCGDPAFLKSEYKAAVVGTRKPSDISLNAAYALSSALSSNGILTVSGGAVGTDRAAHEGALTGSGSTLCVLGNGLGYNYLPERVFLKRRIEKYGAVVTELQPFEGPTQYTFPRRNRIIAALSETLTVIQSDVRGGSLISADYAVRYKKRVFALSPDVFASRGCEKLISSGASELTDASQIIKRYIPVSASFPLKNNGSGIPAILKPESCTLEEFALLNGVSQAEAYPLYSDILFSSENRKKTENENTPSQKRPKTVKKAADKKNYPAPQNILKEKIAETQGLSPAERALFLSIGKEPESLDALAEKTGIDTPELMSAVTALELMELVVTHPGNRVSLK